MKSVFASFEFTHCIFAKCLFAIGNCVITIDKLLTASQVGIKFASICVFIEMRSWLAVSFDAICIFACYYTCQIGFDASFIALTAVISIGIQIFTPSISIDFAYRFIGVANS